MGVDDWFTTLFFINWQYFVGVSLALLITPLHRRRGATAVLVRKRLQWHRHDRRGSAVVPSLIAVAPRKTVKTADLRGGTAETLNMFKTSAVPLRVEPIRSGIAAVTDVTAMWHRTRTVVEPPSPPCLRSRTAVQSQKSWQSTLRRSRGSSTAVTCVT